MKKFISFVMAGAMVASLVPATAFAKGDVTATAKVVDALEMTKDEAKVKPVINEANYPNDVPELQLKITDEYYRVTDSGDATMDLELTLDNAEFKDADDNDMTEAELKALVSVIDDDGKDVLGVWREDAGKSVTVEDAEAAYDDTTKIATLIYNNNVPEKAGFYKSTSDYIMIQGNDDFKADFAVDDEDPTGDDYDTRLATAWTNYAAVPANHVTAAEYELGSYAGNDAYVRKTEDPTGTEPSYVLVSALTIAPADKYDEADVKTNIKNKLDAKVADGYAIKELTVADGAPGVDGGTLSVEVKEYNDDSVTYTFTGFFQEDDKVIIDMVSKLTKSSENTKATVSVDSDMVKQDDLVYATVLGSGIKASIKKTVDVAEDEKETLYSNGLKIESSVGDFVTGQKFELKLSNGFEFTSNCASSDAGKYTFSDRDENEMNVTYKGTGDDEFTIDGEDIEIEATSAKSGSTATLTVKALKDSGISGTFSDTVKVEVAKVCDYKVDLTVDEDEDVPVIYSATNVDNKGLTDDSDHWSLEVTAEETFPGAWSMRKGFNFNLPEGVYVTDVDVTDTDNFLMGKNDEHVNNADWEKAFFDAYQDGDHKNFEFEKRVFNDVNTKLEDDPAMVKFKLQLVADPTFEGDVVLKFEGDLVDEQEVTIAKFTKPYTIKAEQNDVIIDYRNTEVKTPIVITEAEAGLWEKDIDDLFKLKIEDNLLEFEDDATFTVDSDSDMKLKDEDTDKGTLVFTVDDESDDKPATVTISDMKLFMQRNIPAGAYDLEISTAMSDAYDAQLLFAPDAIDEYIDDGTYDAAVDDLKDGYDNGGDRDSDELKEDSLVEDVCDYSDTVKEAFINVVTAGVDKNNMFTTKVVVPVGESYLVAGEAKVELDAPAYISAAGYTMLPVRAISKALGVDTNNVLWNAETRTVTIMYAQRIISMTVGQKTIYVNGSSIPTSAAPEITNGRTYLPLRDLGTALGVTNVSWDGATKTATLN